MYALAKETGTIVEIAYDPKISHTKDYIQALGSKILKESDPRLEVTHISLSDKVESSQKNALTDGPPGFPQIFPELPPQEQMMDMLYGKGHVFSYPKNDSVEKLSKIPRVAQSLPIQTQFHYEDKESDSAFSAMVGCSDSAVSTSFQVGTSFDPPAGDSRVGKLSRRRPPSWKRKAQTVKAVPNRRNSAASSLTPNEKGGKSKLG
ncbi:hypothetical protein F2Q68_00026660 [Brassica cretica]|uniref:Uncharacterized protein n=1 Tax=Brassica cretica TaxID=69181 RepID=A0A8S9IA52_BRACR|nr:hypothetical protein F2Q68_00026660 [Brassica cretica]